MNCDIEGSLLPDPCPTIENIPLPCSRKLWEAQTRTKWEEEYKNYLLTKRRSRPLLTKALLDSTNAKTGSMESDLLDDLSRWSEEVDGYGSLLIMALSGLDFTIPV